MPQDRGCGCEHNLSTEDTDGEEGPRHDRLIWIPFLAISVKDKPKQKNGMASTTQTLNKYQKDTEKVPNEVNSVSLNED